MVPEVLGKGNVLITFCCSDKILEKQLEEDRHLAHGFSSNRPWLAGSIFFVGMWSVKYHGG